MQAVTPRPVRLSVIVPVYNEAPLIGEVIERVRRAPLPAGVTREIVVVDDGSTDGTWSRLQPFSREPDVRVYWSAINGGKGTAIRAGIDAATGDVILIQDADLEYDPDDHAKMIEPIVSGGAAVVYGSRFRGSIDGMHAANRIANLVLRVMVNVLYGAHVTDEATAYKAFRADVLRGMRFEARRFEWCPEVTAKVLRSGYRITEVPVRYRARSIAQGKKIRWWDLAHAMWTLVRHRFGPMVVPALDAQAAPHKYEA